MTDQPHIEDERHEFKKQWVDRALEDITAFSNHLGGKLYIGLQDDGTVVGFGGNDHEQQRIASKISDVLHLTPQFGFATIEKQPILVITIEPGSRLISYKGRYFTRVGSTNRDMTSEEIGRRHMEVVGQTWDSLTGPWGIDAVDPTILRMFVREARDRLPGLSSDDSPETILQNLQLIREGKLTNAAVLLFTSKPQILFPQAQVRIGRFKSSEIIDSHDFEGSLWDQVDKCMQRFRDMLQVRFEVDIKEPNLKGARREEIWEYPLGALREALLNALIHRDYSVPAAIQIRVDDNQLTAWNAGNLLQGIELEQLREPGHPSILRNPLIAKVFFYAKLIERWGTGTTRIIDQCRHQRLPEPSFEEDNHGFRLTFISDPYKPERLEEMGLGPRQLQIIEFVHEKKKISLPDLMGIFPDLTERTIRRDLKSLVEKNLLRAEGTKKGRSYTPI
ncbi:MAG: putative DNA binding domain-containing protein [Candidatus Marinimicrobia bacterium]|nr:putative DNA binding domain-containing protein [Candidatus Neomarinimicrobiota bacterium]